MDKKQMYVQVINLNTGKMFSLPTLYTDRVEACVCGQNYVRDHWQENHDDVFYRVLIAEDGKIVEPDYFTIGGEDEDEDEDEEEAEKSAMDMVMALTDFICEHCTVNN